MATSAVIYLTDHDRKRLVTLLDVALSSPDTSVRPDLRRLNVELERAQVVRSEEVPPDVVTLNSQVLVKDLEDGEESRWLLTFPTDANVFENKISVLSPVGTALIGARKGDEIEWHSEGGGGRLLVKDILYQPEAAGRFDL
jgi:regulator of nucleoside diphosphate kinase